MKSYTEKLGELWEDATISIDNKISEVGKESKHLNGKRVIIVDMELAFNLDYGRFLTEISKDELIDNMGYIYSYGALSYEDLMELADWVQTLKK